jgi:ribosomal protein L29
MAKIKQMIETLRKKDAKALRAELADLKIQLQKARVDMAFGRMTKPSTIVGLRKQIARIQTILKEQEAVNA